MANQVVFIQTKHSTYYTLSNDRRVDTTRGEVAEYSHNGIDEELNEMTVRRIITGTKHHSVKYR